MANNYEWKVIDYSFILHKNGEPTDTCVNYCRAAWQAWDITDERDLNVIDAVTPSDAMDFVNEQLGIDAPYDENRGIKEITDFLNSTINKTINRIQTDILDLRSYLSMLSGVKKDMVLMVRQSIIDDELQIAYDTISAAGNRYKYQ